MPAFLAGAIGLGLAGAASGAPPGLTEKDGALLSADGRHLYVYANDKVPGVSTCTAGCLVAFPPLKPEPGARSDADWTIFIRDDGGAQWAYRGRPVHTYVADETGNPPSGLSPLWSLAGPSTAPSAPVRKKSDAVEKDGFWQTADGKPLYTYAMDAPGKPACTGNCLVAWPPFAAPDAEAGGDGWEVLKRETGVLQWMHAGKPVYTYVADQAGAAATGVSALWKLAAAKAADAPAPTSKPAEPAEILALYLMGDPRITTLPALRPGTQAPMYPAEAEQARHGGETTGEFCIDPQGRVENGELTVSSGHKSLDEAFFNWASSNVFLPGKVGETAVRVCAFRFGMTWSLPAPAAEAVPAAAPAPAAQ